MTAIQSVNFDHTASHDGLRFAAEHFQSYATQKMTGPGNECGKYLVHRQSGHGEVTWP